MELLHRAAVAYPLEAIRNGVQGTVSVQVKLNSSGEVDDAQVLSGPDELRKPVLQSVLQWHFGESSAGTTRTIDIAFALPKQTAAPTVGAAAGVPPRPPFPIGTVHTIRVEGLSEQAASQLLASLPIHQGDEWNADSARTAQQAVHAFDEHLNIRQQSMMLPGGTPQLDLVISNMPSRIRVGGNVQSAMVVTKVAPVYPAAAKAAGITGTVNLSVIVGTDGTVQELTVVDGPPELTQSALDAVKQWVYRPSRLNGNPVQVETTIAVNYTLNR
jgi:protein TonB